MTSPGKVTETERERTSYSIGIVTGEVANLLGRDIVPFNTSDGNLVKNLRDYLRLDSGSWSRYPDTRVIWNRVTEEKNPRIQQPPQPVVLTEH